MDNYNFVITADYHQFYIEDKSIVADSSKHLWTDEQIAARLSVCPHSIGIMTFREGKLPVQIIILDNPDYKIEAKGYDKVSKGEIRVPSQKLILSAPFSYRPDCPVILLNKEVYNIQVYYYGENTISEDGFEGNDYYEVYLIPLTT